MVSTSSAVATPSSTTEVASFSSAYWRRLSTMPGVSATCAPWLPDFSSSSLTAAIASGVVSLPATSSTPGMKGAGLEKWTVRNRSGCFTALSSSLTGMVEVLVPMMASGRACSEIFARTSRLTSMRSNTASSMKSTSATASSMVLPAEMFFATRSAEPGAYRPCSSNSRASFWRRSREALAFSTLTSAMVTSNPAMARTWAIPPPM